MQLGKAPGSGDDREEDEPKPGTVGLATGQEASLSPSWEASAPCPEVPALNLSPG